MGLTDNFKVIYQKSYLKLLISSVLRESKEELEQQKKLDGVAWIKDLKPVLNKFLLEFIDRILDPNLIQIRDETLEVNKRKISSKRLKSKMMINPKKKQKLKIFSN